MAKWRKYRLAKPAGRGRGRDRLLAIALLGAVVFGLWKYSREHGHSPKPKAGKPVLHSATVSKASPPASTQPAKPNGPIEVAAAPETVFATRSTRDTLEAQVALARAGISSGSLDGVIGSQTRAAIRAFQRKRGLPTTGMLDTNTRPFLTLTAPALATYVITTNDLVRLQPLSKTWLGKSQQSALEYETVLELVSEKFQGNPKLIKQLNSGVDWTNVFPNTVVTVPDVAFPEPTVRAASVVISLSEKTMEAFDAETNLLAHFPCSIAARVEKRPLGELHVVAVAPRPNYTFDPEVFPESPEARELGRKLIIAPGPNNPVGTVWISLDRPGYGIHGTPKPEEVGRTESHGCFRLANWNAEFLLKLAWVGMPVQVVP